jgi:sulfur carrier protein
MKILIINGEAREMEAGTLAELLQQLNYDSAWLATAINGEVVRRDARHGIHLSEGDRIEILSPMQGG